MDPNRNKHLIGLAQSIVHRAQKSGVAIAEVGLREGFHLSASIRKGEPEHVEEAGSKSIALRVIDDQRVAVSYTSDFSEAGIARLVADAVELCRLSERDENAGPPDPSELMAENERPDLDLGDPSVESIDAAVALRRAKDSEHIALGYDKRITNSEGASFSRGHGRSVLVTSGGFKGSVEGTLASLAVSPIAEEPDGKKRVGSYWTSKRFLSDLEDGKAVGTEAARRTIGKLGAQKIKTQEVAVVFDPDAARSMLGLVAGCVNGHAIWRRSSYLIDRENTQVASNLVTLVDDPHIPRGLGSKIFDGEGLATRRNVIIENGILKTYLLDTYSARKLGKKSTASASRSSGGGISVSTTNLMLSPGKVTRKELIDSTDRALYVTDMMGFGFNAVTGDFSRGASGFWLEGGEFKYPVSEVTISINLNDFLHRIDAIANDLDYRSSTITPTFRVGAMIVAGN